MKKEDFKREVLFNNKVIYKYIKNGELRIKAINACKAGKITQEEMRKLCKKAKYLFSEKEYLEAIK